MSSTNEEKQGASIPAVNNEGHTASYAFELLKSAHELLDPSEILWNLDCNLKRGLKADRVPWANRALRFVMSYEVEKRPLFTVDHVAYLMHRNGILEPDTERELVRLYPSLVKTRGFKPNQE